MLQNETFYPKHPTYGPYYGAPSNHYNTEVIHNNSAAHYSGNNNGPRPWTQHQQDQLGVQPQQQYYRNDDGSSSFRDPHQAVAAAIIPPLLHSIWWSHRDKNTNRPSFPYLPQNRFHRIQKRQLTTDETQVIGHRIPSLKHHYIDLIFEMIRLRSAPWPQCTRCHRLQWTMRGTGCTWSICRGRGTISRYGLSSVLGGMGPATVSVKYPQATVPLVDKNTFRRDSSHWTGREGACVVKFFGSHTVVSVKLFPHPLEALLKYPLWIIYFLILTYIIHINRTMFIKLGFYSISSAVEYLLTVQGSSSLFYVFLPVCVTMIGNLVFIFILMVENRKCSWLKMEVNKFFFCILYSS
jgi:hypothetical protein